MMGRKESHQTHLLRQIVAGLAAVLLLVGTSAQAAQDIFIWMDRIPGESTDQAHKDEIEVLSLSWGMANSGTMHVSGGAGGGKVNFNDLSFTHYVDKASPGLMLYCAMGRVIPEVRIFVRKAGEAPLEYVKITLTNVLIASVETAVSGGQDRAIENVSLNFERIHYEYTPQKADGSREAAIPMQWNIATNSTK